MTIAAALACDTGFVLCADRMMTHGKATEFGAFAHYDKKVFPLENIDFAAVMCGAGDSLLMRAVAEEVLRKADESQPTSTDNVPQLLEDSLNNVATRIGGIPDLSLVLAAAMTDGEPRFIRSDGLVIQPANSVEILGIGETSLVRYLVDSLFSPAMSLAELTALGIFIILVAKKYCPQYCGGPTDVCVLPKNYAWETVPVEADKITEIENLWGFQAPKQLQALLSEAAGILK